MLTTPVILQDKITQGVRAVKRDTTKAKEKATTAVKAIRLHCLSCSCDNAAEVRRCELTDCNLYKFRMGRNPNIKRVMTDAQKQAQAVRLKEAREKKEFVNG